MTAILAIVERILGLLLSLLGLTSLVREQTRYAAQEHSDYLIEGIVTTTGIAVAHPTYGLQAIQNAISALAVAVGAGNADILAAIAALPAGSGLINPPSAGQNAEAVWLATLPLSGGWIAGQAQWYAAELAKKTGEMGGWRTPDNPLFMYRGWLWDWTKPLPDHGWPTGDWLDIQPDDTRLTWLTRTEPGWTWTLDQDSGLVQAETYEGGTSRFTLTEPEFRAVRDLLAGVASLAPPVWPGADNVTWGTPVPLAQGVFVDEACDGLLLQVTATDRLIPYMTAGSYRLYRNLGRVTFLSDAPSAESWQGIPADVCVLVPKALAHATGALLSFYTGVTGTVTPWTITMPA